MIPQPVEIEVAGKRLSVLPIKVGRLPAFIRAVAPFIEVFGQRRAEINFVALLTDHGEAVLDACAIGAGVERAWIDELDPAQLVRVAQAVVEANMDFFTRKLAPAIVQAAARVGTLNGGSFSPA